MDSIYRGDLATARGRRNAWADSLLVDHAALRTVWTNWGVVAPGRLYRSNHPTPGRLAHAVRRDGIRTILNLRGFCENGSDALARETALRLGVAFVDAPLRSRAAPSRAAVLHLLEALGGMREPGLVYCKSGADRTGFAAGLFVLQEGGTAAEALSQLSWRFGHLPRSRAGVLGDFFRLFARAGEGRVGFADWVRTEYDPDALSRAFRPGALSGFAHDHILARE